MPVAKAMKAQRKGPADGQSPTLATATSTPNAAAAPAIRASSGSDDATHTPLRPPARATLFPAADARWNPRSSNAVGAVPCMSMAISSCVMAKE